MQTVIKTALAATLAFTVGLVLTGCVTGSGTIVTEQRSVGEFDSVEVSGIGRLEITQGRQTELTVQADDNLLQYIKTETDDGTLRISVRYRGLPFMPIDPSETIVYRLTVPELSRISLSGSGDIVADRFEADSLEIDISGSGDVELGDLTASSFSYTLSGSGSAKLAGAVETQDITISGSGRLEAQELESQRTSIVISGSGRATVWATERLDVDVSGSGQVRYRGSPDVSQNVSGSGSVQALGSE